MFSFIFSLLIGALAGSIAGRIMGSETSAVRNIVLGIGHRSLCLHLGRPQAVQVSSPS